MKCYRCKKIGDTIYCPFFDINPCIRGEHEIILPKPKVKAVVKHQHHIREIKVPKMLEGSKFVPHTRQILIGIIKGYTMNDIAKDIKSNAQSVGKYINKLLNFYGLDRNDLKNYKYD